MGLHIVHQLFRQFFRLLIGARILLQIEAYSHYGVVIVIKDNGKGFDMEAVHARTFENRGLGLVTMQERARMLGGNMKIETRPGCGTHLQFTVPVDKGSRHGNL